MLPAAGIWLARCCEQIEGIQDATLFLNGVEQIAARWPDPDDESEVHLDVAAATFASRRGVARPRAKDESGRPQPGRLLGIPIGLGSRNLAVVAVTCVVEESASAALTARIEAASQWLPILLTAGSDSQGSAKHGLMTKFVTTLLEPDEAAEAYLALVSELATALACDRVSLGFCQGETITLEAVSHSARFDVRTRLGRSIAAAMEEAVDAEESVRWPGEAEKAPHRAHAELCQAHEMGSAFSVPLTAHGEAIGAICAEYRNRHPAGPLIASRMEQLAVLLGPLIALRREAARPVGAQIRTRLKTLRAEWVGEKRRTQQVLVGTVLVVLAILAFVPGTYRIGSPARLEGLVQRAIVAPIDGYVAESRARAGDIIKKGAVLGAIDDTDLRLERRKWVAHAAQLNKEYRAALAARDRSEANILRARLAQAQAELDLVKQQLARTRLVAPFDGVVAEGDLSRSLGSPVARGDVLFQVAPLDRYRIVLEVDETEIDEIRAGQKGWLKLTAQPGDDLALIVERIVPVAVAEDGRNFFRVEAQLEEPVDTLRPGMEGVGKVEVGRRGLLWIYTHSLFDWMRLRLWAWLP